MSKFFIHAPNIHQGGGAILLTELLREMQHDSSIHAVLDERMIAFEELPGDRVIRVAPTLRRRLAAEFRLAKLVNRGDRVLCFGNLPPLLPLRGRVDVFLQNRYLVDSRAPISALPLKVRLRLLLERVWLRLFCLNASRYFVQTSSMQILAQRTLGKPVECFALMPEVLRNLRKSELSVPSRYDFIYVASGEAHKNHRILMDAWKLLAEEGLFPSLALTLSRENANELVDEIEAEAARSSLNIENLTCMQHEHLVELYGAVRALIYPSDFESFGLPLIEAGRLGLPILAPELDYVRDVIDPVETFDSRSAVSIARAVKRFLKRPRPGVEFLGARELLGRIHKEIVK